jgi:DNA mismatch endonuclease (patch repair protein)
MADVFTRAKRSEIMSRVKSRGNLLTELRLIGLFREHGFIGWRRKVRLFGNPDFVFPATRIAIFVDGCFWHGCPVHGGVPKTNRAFWGRKLTRNKERDRLVNKTLKGMGWSPLRVWQHELRQPEDLVRRLERRLDRGTRSIRQSDANSRGR